MGMVLINVMDAGLACDLQTLWFGLNVDGFYVSRYLTIFMTRLHCSLREDLPQTYRLDAAW